MQVTARAENTAFLKYRTEMCRSKGYKFGIFQCESLTAKDLCGRASRGAWPDPTAASLQAGGRAPFDISSELYRKFHTVDKYSMDKPFFARGWRACKPVPSGRKKGTQEEG